MGKVTPSPLETRPIRHKGCGQVTEVTGNDLRVLTNPYSGAATFHCAHCKGSDFISGFAWADTGEDLVGYRKRVKKFTPPLVWFFREGVALIVAVALGALTWLVAREFVKDVDFLLWYCIGGWGAVGLLAFFVSEPMAEGVDYRGYK